MARGVQLVDVALGGGDGGVVGARRPGDVLAPPLVEVVLVELDEKGVDAGRRHRRAVAKDGVEQGDDLGARRHRVHLRPCRGRTTDRAAGTPCPRATATRAYASATTSPAAITPSREVWRAASTTMAPDRSRSTWPRTSSVRGSRAIFTTTPSAGTRRRCPSRSRRTTSSRRSPPCS